MLAPPAFHLVNRVLNQICIRQDTQSRLPLIVQTKFTKLFPNYTLTNRVQLSRRQLAHKSA